MEGTLLWIVELEKSVFFMKTRLSLGSAVLLGLKKAKCDVLPTTVYIMLGEHCTGNCSFCAQTIFKKREKRKGKDGYLSRVVWPEFPFEKILDGLYLNKGKYRRICFQCLNYKMMLRDLKRSVRDIKKAGIEVPVSVSSVPVKKEDMLELKKMGVSQMTFSLDAATEEIFNKIKGSERGGVFTWGDYLKALQESREIFGRALTHLIVGLGETDKDIFKLVDALHREGIFVSLFAFTPLEKKVGKAPDPVRYHIIQLFTWLIYKGFVKVHDMKFQRDGNLLFGGISYKEIIKRLNSGEEWLLKVFNTSGCEGCNRPFYNEKPSGPIYNYAKTPEKDVVVTILKEIKRRGVI